MKLTKMPPEVTMRVLQSARPAMRVGLVSFEAHSAGTKHKTNLVIQNLIRHGQATAAPKNGATSVFVTPAGFSWFQEQQTRLAQAARKKEHRARSDEAAGGLVAAYGEKWPIRLLAQSFGNKPVLVAKSGLMPRIPNRHVRSMLKPSVRSDAAMMAIARTWIGQGLVRNADGFNAPLRSGMDFFLTKKGEAEVASFVKGLAKPAAAPASSPQNAPIAADGYRP